MWSFHHGSSLLNVGLGISKGSNTTLWNPGMEICFLWNFQGQSKAMKIPEFFSKFICSTLLPPPLPLTPVCFFSGIAPFTVLQQAPLLKTAIYKAEWNPFS